MLHVWAAMPRLWLGLQSGPLVNLRDDNAGYQDAFAVGIISSAALAELSTVVHCVTVWLGAGRQCSACVCGAQHHAVSGGLLCLRSCL